MKLPNISCTQIHHLDSDMNKMRNLLGTFYDLKTEKGRQHCDSVYAYMRSRFQCEHGKLDIFELTFIAMKCSLLILLLVHLMIKIKKRVYHKKEKGPPSKLEDMVIYTENKLEALFLILLGTILAYKFDLTRHTLAYIGIIDSKHVSPIKFNSTAEDVMISISGFLLLSRGVHLLDVEIPFIKDSK